MGDGPVAIVTGAGSGIGRATAIALAQAGFQVALAGRTESTLESTAAAIREASLDPPQEVLVAYADVSDPRQVQTLIGAVMNRFSRIDVLVNNAAVCPVVRIDAISEKALHQTFATNLFGPALLIATVLPVMRRQGGGRVINISSIATIDPFPGLGVYAASKAALESLTRSIAGEMGGEGVEAYSIAPGAVETAMLRSVVSETDLPPDKALAPEVIAQVIVDCATGRRNADNGRVVVVSASA